MKLRLFATCGLLALLIVMLPLSGATAQSTTTFPKRIGRKIPFAGPLPQLQPASARLNPRTGLQPRATSADQGNISVLQDDGTLLVPVNTFDLGNSTIQFIPQGNGYTVQSVTPTFISPSSNARVLSLGGGSAAVPLGFNFKFYGTTYNTAYVNSSGNLTFTAADQADFYFGLNTLSTGLPRIAALLDYMVDSYGGGSGQIGYDTFSDHINFYWFQVEDSTGQLNTFEIILLNNGTIEFNYNTVGATSASVGISPGNATSLQTVDFSHQTSPLAFTGAIGETFSQFEDIDLGAVAQTFYQTHPDNYDGMVVFADVAGMSGAYAQQVRNATKGINIECSQPPCLFDYGTYFGSKGRLFIAANMGSASQYPADPTQIFSGTYSTLAEVGQMIGTAWMPYVDINPPALLPDQYGPPASWSFLMDAEGSVMGGNLIQNLGNGQFTTANATFKYSPLDEYLMGLRAPSNVPNWFVVNNPVQISAPSGFTCVPLNPDCPATVGVTFSGTAQTVSLSQVTAVAGARVPSASTSQKNFNVVFVIVTAQGQSVNPQNLAQVDTIRQQWGPWFVNATDNLGGMTTTLQANAPTITSVNPNQGIGIGGSLVTVTGTNFQSSSVVTIGGNAAAVVAETPTSLQVIAPPSGGQAAVQLTVTNPDGQNASSTYTYNNAAQSQLQMTLPTSGSVLTETTGTSPTLQVGYGVISPPTGVAVIRSFTNGLLASETAVPPTPAATQWLSYAEVGSGGVSTGIAIANPGTSPATLTLTLSSGAQTQYPVPAGAQVAKFVNEFFPGTTSFLGTMSIQSNTPVSVVGLRGTVNASGEFIIATIPLSSGSASTGSLATFPIIADGGGYNTDIILVNSGTSTSTGNLVLYEFPGNVQTDQGTNTQFAFSVPAGGMYRLRTSGATNPEVSGYAVMQVSSGPVPSATAIVRYSSGNNLISETAIPAQNTFAQAMMFGSLENNPQSNLRTGIALLNGNGESVLVTFTPLNTAGQSIGVTGSVTVPPYQSVAKFLDEMIPTLPVGFEGTVLVQPSAPIYAISLRGSTVNGQFLMSTTPVLNTSLSYSGTYYFPQVVDGPGYTTAFLLMNAGSGNVQLQFFNNAGQAMSLSFQ